MKHFLFFTFMTQVFYQGYTFFILFVLKCKKRKHNLSTLLYCIDIQLNPYIIGIN
jgi:hypothetical protein